MAADLSCLPDLGRAALYGEGIEAAVLTGHPSARAGGYTDRIMGALGSRNLVGMGG